MNEIIEFCKLNGLSFFNLQGLGVLMPDGKILRRSGDLRYDLFLKDIKEYYEQINTKGIKEEQ